MTGYIILDDVPVLFTYNEPILTLYFDSVLKDNKVNLDLENKCISKKIPYLIGYDIEEHRKIIFFVRELPDRQSIFSSQDIKVNSYIYYNNNVEKITGMQFCSDEINYFYDVRKGYEMIINDKKECEVKIVPFIDTREEFDFNDGIENIKCICGIGVSLNVDTVAPINIKPRLSLQFNETSDYDKIRKRYYIIEQFFSFICYRKNIDFRDVLLLGRNESNKTIIIGKLHNNYHIEKEDISKVKNTVKYDLLKPHIKDIFEIIAKDNLYIQHIPNTYKERLTITPSRFILITAAFEWNIRGLYEIPISKKQEKVKADIIEAISKIPDEKSYNRKLRDKLDFYIKIINNIDVNLGGKILYALNDLSPILEIFIKNIFAINKKNVDTYSNISNRIQSQRNNYAHGNIDKEMNSDVILDIIILEWVNYAIVFKQVGYTDEEITKLINIIFNRNFAIS